MSRSVSRCLWAAWLTLSAATGAPTQEPAAVVIEHIEVAGNQFLQQATLLYYIQTKPGDRYEVRRLREDFRRLWDTGFLDDLQIEVVDGASGGKLVRFKVQERKRIQLVDFRGSKVLTSSNIEDELKKREAQVKVDTFYDPAKARRVESIVKEMLVAKGRPFATVRHEAKSMGVAGQQLSFIVDDGPKTKVKEIVFEGNEVYSDGKLRARMKKVKEPGFWNLSWLSGKTTYSEAKWLGDEEDPRGDRGRVEELYLNNGYVTARVGNPKITYTDGKSGTFKKKPVKWMRLEIPVTEGEQYRVGDVKFEGLTVLKEPFVRSYFKMTPGDVYNDAKFKKAYEKLRDIYGSLGYFQWTGGTQRKPDPERKVVDVTVRMEEDKQYFLGHLNFTGNDSTRDKVIRREIYMNEGEVFNTEALKLSIKRINQLGYFKPMESAPEILPTPGSDNKVDVTFKIEEQNRNQFTFGGGVSGLEGTFLNASFATTNFLGAGETVSLAAQTGRRSRNFQFSVSEPYFLDRPITVGADVFLRRLVYQSYGTFVGYGQQQQGFSVNAGVGLGRFTRAYTGYSFDVIDIYDVDTRTLAEQERGLASTTLPTTATDPSALGGLGRRFESGVKLSAIRNTVDNPWSPRSGMRHTGSVQFVGGPLGGTVDYIRPTWESIVYVPVRRRMALGVRGQLGWIRPFGGTDSIPYYQRYFLGGETQIRGVNVQSVAPYDPETKTSLGGDKFLLVNAEYYFDVFGPVRLLAFFDAGEAYPEGQGFWWRTMTTSTGLELRFVMPVLNVPFRLIYAWNPNRDFYQPATAFKFAVGTTF